MKHLLVALAAAGVVTASLASCASTAPYGPADSPNRAGYFEQQIEPERFRVSYRGGSGMGPNQTEDLVMLRAADLTLEHGYDWFRIVERYGQAAPPTRPRLSFGIGGSRFGRSSAIGVGTSTGFGGETAYVSNLEILIGRGAKPGTPDAYSAREVADIIRPRAAAR